MGIFLVILSHTPLDNFTLSFIYTFHMPLFFFLSGYLNKRSIQQTSNFLKKRFRRLIIPFLFFNTLSFFFWLFIRRNIGTSELINTMSPYTLLKNIVLVYPHDMIHNVPIWFLFCLFIVNIAYIFSTAIIKRTHVLLIATTIIVIVESTFNQSILPWCLNLFPAGLFFFLLGIISKEKNIFSSQPRTIHVILLFTVSLITTIIITRLNGKIAMHTHEYGNILMFLVGGIAGIIFCVILSIFLSSLISANKFIDFISANTLAICGFHLTTFTFIKGLMIFVLKLSPDILDDNLFFNFTFALVSLFLCLPFIFLVKQFFPALIGADNFHNNE